METFTARVSDLKTSYYFSKDSITMLWEGKFNEEKVVETLKEKFGCLKQLTVSFVQKKMEIKMSRQDFAENFHAIMTNLSELMKEAGFKSKEQLSLTKEKTVDLYQSVLKRIKQKERLMMVREELVELEK